VIRTAYLRIYEPAATFTEDERRRWLTEPDDGEAGDHQTYRSWLVTGRLPQGEPGYSATEITIVVNTHLHFDHAGGLAGLKRLTGATLQAPCSRKKTTVRRRIRRSGACDSLGFAPGRTH